MYPDPLDKDIIKVMVILSEKRYHKTPQRKNAKSTIWDGIFMGVVYHDLLRQPLQARLERTSHVNSTLLEQ